MSSSLSVRNCLGPSVGGFELGFGVGRVRALRQRRRGPFLASLAAQIPVHRAVTDAAAPEVAVPAGVLQDAADELGPQRPELFGRSPNLAAGRPSTVSHQ